MTPGANSWESAAVAGTPARADRRGTAREARLSSSKSKGRELVAHGVVPVSSAQTSKRHFPRARLRAELKRISNRSSISLRRTMDGAGAEPEVDRTKQCPMLLRCFWKLDGHTEAVEYAQASKGSLPAQEIQIHTWPDCTLRELADLIQDANPVARDGRIRLSFALVYPTREGRFTMREISSLSGRQGGADVGAGERCGASSSRQATSPRRGHSPCTEERKHKRAVSVACSHPCLKTTSPVAARARARVRARDTRSAVRLGGARCAAQSSPSARRELRTPRGAAIA